MGIRIKYFPHQSGVNSDQAAPMNVALVTELEIDAKPASMISYDVKISSAPSDFPFGTIKFDPC